MSNAQGEVITISSAQHWQEQLSKATTAGQLVVVDFTATWCPPCRFIAPMFSKHAQHFPFIMFLKVDVDDLKDVASEWCVEAMPTFVFIKEGKEIDRIVGASKDDLRVKIEKHSAEMIKR